MIQRTWKGYQGKYSRRINNGTINRDRVTPFSKGKWWLPHLPYLRPLYLGWPISLSIAHTHILFQSNNEDDDNQCLFSYVKSTSRPSSKRSQSIKSKSGTLQRKPPLKGFLRRAPSVPPEAAPARASTKKKKKSNRRKDSDRIVLTSGHNESNAHSKKSTMNRVCIFVVYEGVSFVRHGFYLFIY